MAKKKEAEEATIVLTRLDESVIEIPIVGITPVIPHRWSTKAKMGLGGHPDGAGVKKAKEKRIPEEEADACLYKLEDGALGMPATAFKAATVGGCRFFKAPSMVEAKQLLFIEGRGVDQLVEISGTKQLREDTPRNANGNADLRYRYAIHDWSSVLRVRFVPERITRESIIALVDAGGRGGIGDWRPSAPKSSTGTFGTYRVDDKKEVRDV